MNSFSKLDLVISRLMTLIDKDKVYYSKRRKKWVRTANNVIQLKQKKFRTKNRLNIMKKLLSNTSKISFNESDQWDDPGVSQGLLDSGYEEVTSWNSSLTTDSEGFNDSDSDKNNSLKCVSTSVDIENNVSSSFLKDGKALITDQNANYVVTKERQETDDSTLTVKTHTIAEQNIQGSKKPAKKHWKSKKIKYLITRKQQKNKIIETSVKLETANSIDTLITKDIEKEIKTFVVQEETQNKKGLILIKLNSQIDNDVLTNTEGQKAIFEKSPDVSDGEMSTAKTTVILYDNQENKDGYAIEKQTAPTINGRLCDLAMDANDALLNKIKINALIKKLDDKIETIMKMSVLASSSPKEDVKTSLALQSFVCAESGLPDTAEVEKQVSDVVDDCKDVMAETKKKVNSSISESTNEINTNEGYANTEKKHQSSADNQDFETYDSVAFEHVNLDIGTQNNIVGNKSIDKKATKAINIVDLTLIIQKTANMIAKEKIKKSFAASLVNLSIDNNSYVSAIINNPSGKPINYKEQASLILNNIAKNEKNTQLNDSNGDPAVTFISSDNINGFTQTTDLTGPAINELEVVQMTNSNALDNTTTSTHAAPESIVLNHFISQRNNNILTSPLSLTEDSFNEDININENISNEGTTENIIDLDLNEAIDEYIPNTFNGDDILTRSYLENNKLIDIDLDITMKVDSYSSNSTTISLEDENEEATNPSDKTLLDTSLESTQNYQLQNPQSSCLTDIDKLLDIKLPYTNGSHIILCESSITSEGSPQLPNPSIKPAEEYKISFPIRKSSKKFLESAIELDKKTPKANQLPCRENTVADNYIEDLLSGNAQGNDKDVNNKEKDRSDAANDIATNIIHNSREGINIETVDSNMSASVHSPTQDHKNNYKTLLTISESASPIFNTKKNKSIALSQSFVSISTNSQFNTLQCVLGASSPNSDTTNESNNEDNKTEEKAAELTEPIHALTVHGPSICHNINDKNSIVGDKQSISSAIQLPGKSATVEYLLGCNTNRTLVSKSCDGINKTKQPMILAESNTDMQPKSHMKTTRLYKARRNRLKNFYKTHSKTDENSHPCSPIKNNELSFNEPNVGENELTIVDDEDTAIIPCNLQYQCYPQIFEIINRGELEMDERFLEMLQSILEKLEKSSDPFTCKVCVDLSLCMNYVRDFIELKRLAKKVPKSC